MRLIKSALRNKLRNYSILAGSALAASTANGQIIYHNLNPDEVLNMSGQEYHLDLNGNGETDFTIREYQGNFNEAEIFPDYKSAGNIYNAIGGIIKTTGSYKFGFPKAYSSGQKIGSKVNWFNLFDLFNPAYQFVIPAMGYVNGTYKAGKWLGAPDKFLALKLVVRSSAHSDSLTYYGWARCGVTPDAKSLTIFDYAYQSISDSSIIAGDTGIAAGSISHRLQSVIIYSSRKNVFVKYPFASDGIIITVTDMLGKEVQAIQTTSELYEMNLSNAATGVYNITVRSKGDEVTKKVLIQ